jgi:DNA-binding Xre family transcriptional regulator
MTQDGLADAMRKLGIDWQRVIAAKLESGQRSFVKVDELIGLCLVLQISPVDLLVPKDLGEDQSYRLTSNSTATSGNVREWVRGERLIHAGVENPDLDIPFVTPLGAAEVAAFVQWMPEERAKRVVQHYYYEMEQRDQWIAEEEEKAHSQRATQRRLPEDDR